MFPSILGMTKKNCGEIKKVAIYNFTVINIYKIQGQPQIYQDMLYKRDGFFVMLLLKMNTD